MTRYAVVWSSSSPRIAKVICLLAIAAAPALLYGAGKAFESNSNNIVDWLPQSFEETQRLFWFVERFGSDEILVISWDGCTLKDERLDVIADKLREPFDVPGQTEPQRWFRKVYTGRQTLAELTLEPPKLSREEALERMDGWLIGEDGRTTCVLAMVSEFGQENRHGAVEFVRNAARSAGIPPGTTYIAGPTADSVAVDVVSNQGIVALGLLSAFVGMLAAWVCLRDMRLMTMLFVSALFAWSMSLSSLYFLGPGMDAVLLVMPGLVFVLGVSGGLHLTNYYRRVLQTGPSRDAAWRAVRRAWWPCTLAIVTTAVGLGSLMISQLTPIRRFGLFASTGVLMTLPALLLLWPSVASWWLPNDRRGDRPLRSGRAERWWLPLYATASRHGRRWLLLCGLALPVFAYGITQLKTSVRLEDLFRSNSEIIRSSEWLRQHLGALIPVEIVLRFPREADQRTTGMLQRALIVEQFRKEVSQSPHFEAAVAATTFAPPLPESGSGPQILRRRLLAGRLPDYRDQFVEFRLLYDEPQEEMWRISARVISSEVDYGTLLASVEDQLQTFLQKRPASEAGVTGEVCGAIPLIHLAQQRLLQDLIVSYVIAFGLILVMMSLLLRSIAGGLLAMIPNVFPAAVAFGVMGLWGVPIDIGTMMTASVAMGVAVDDTVHFLVWFQNGLQEGRSRGDAVRDALAHCATPMLQTTAICGLGMLMFVFSPFVPVSRFGFVMAVMLVLALVGDLLLLPVLLLSALGRIFEPRQPQGSEAVGISQPAGAIALD